MKRLIFAAALLASPALAQQSIHPPPGAGVHPPMQFSPSASNDSQGYQPSVQAQIFALKHQLFMLGQDDFEMSEHEYDLQAQLDAAQAQTSASQTKPVQKSTP